MNPWVVVPTYNERDNVADLAAAILKAFPEGRGNLLFVDDNSPDGTGALIDTLVAGNARIHVLHREQKEGLGRAYVAGFENALAEGATHIIQMDCDFSHDPEDIPRFLAESADLVIGSRYVRGGSTPGWSVKRRLISRLGGLYIRLVTGIPIHDPTGGFKCWTAEAVRKIGLQAVASRGYSFQFEMNWQAWKRGFLIKELPIAFSERRCGESKISFAIALESLRMVKRYRRGVTLERFTK